MVNDPIADFITQIKNAGTARKECVVIPYSKMKSAIAEVLLREGYIEAVNKKGKGVKTSLEIYIKYLQNGKPKIDGVKRISKPSRRLYSNAASVTSVKSGHGKVILSTPAGIVTVKEAKEKSVGGEVLFYIW